MVCYTGRIANILPMQKQVGNKIFDVNGWLVVMFIMLVGAFAVAYIDMRKELVLVREQALRDYLSN
jgi:hypothetical protein